MKKKGKKTAIKGSELPIIGDLLVVTKPHSWSAADGQSLQKVFSGDLILIHDIKHNQTDVEIHASTQTMQKIYTFVSPKRGFFSGTLDRVIPRDDLKD